MIKDQSQRLTALDPTESFIVQAPAGSGKTELLTQRYLVLLARVNAPEEVVAITFTRKAASEMRSRIITALQSATGEAPELPHAYKTWELAKQALKQDQKLSWQLLANPNRLRILTIDAMCAKIAKSAPLLSQFGIIPNIVEDAKPFYAQAARNLLLSLNSDYSWVNALEQLLLHLDNNYMLVESLFIGMLSRRDQWLPYIINHHNVEDSRQILESGLQTILEESLQGAHRLLPPSMKDLLVQLARFAGERLQQARNTSAITTCCNLSTLPGTTLKEHTKWLGICELLLTKEQEWRKTVNKNQGFPASKDGCNAEEKQLFKLMKSQMEQLLQNIQNNDTLKQYLQNISLLPPYYSEKQWHVVAALIEILPALVAHLQMLFNEQGVIDFIAIAQGAIHALGDIDAPSDLALNLDYRLTHLLVDEFQDTSQTQYRLLELLTSGWHAHDGRTLFLVGDPMQSIYRFREAEVGLFLRVKQFGLGDIKLTPLRLEVNFRSKAKVIDWFNQSFAQVFPQVEDSELGAITFSPSSTIDDKAEGEVTIHPLDEKDDEANKIVEIISQTQTIKPNGSIAILVRSRSHLEEIIPALKKAKLNFQAIEIERLINSSAVSDLLALTKALFHLGDRIAWLAVLRAPWCGLNLSDLLAIAHEGPHRLIYEQLHQYENLPNLSADGKKRIARILPILESAIQNRFRKSLHQYIADAWNQLGGPACLDDLHEIQNSKAFFQLLENFDDSHHLDLNLLEQKLVNAYAHTTESEANIHLLTIHKAKGLEYDVVILPGLDRCPASDKSQLLMWLERKNYQGNNDLILAPMKSSEDDFDPIYDYIRRQSKIKAEYEVTRLLYVAATRARESLHLIGTVSFDAERQANKLPSNGSFLNILWPVVQEKFNRVGITAQQETECLEEEAATGAIKRLTIAWQPPTTLIFPKDPEVNRSQNQFTWQASYLNHVGTLIHYYFQLLSDWDQASWYDHLELSKRNWQAQLRMLGVSELHLEKSLHLVQQGLNVILHDQKAHWILQPHLEAKSEFALSFYQDEQLCNIIIDRTFIDEQGYRWIIDYKTSVPEDGNHEGFLQRMKQVYVKQLQSYAQALRLTDTRPIKLGLYFPLFSGWCEWNYED